MRIPSCTLPLSSSARRFRHASPSFAFTLSRFAARFASLLLSICAESAAGAECDARNVLSPLFCIDGVLR